MEECYNTAFPRSPERSLSFSNSHHLICENSSENPIEFSSSQSSSPCKDTFYINKLLHQESTGDIGFQFGLQCAEQNDIIQNDAATDNLRKLPPFGLENERQPGEYDNKRISRNSNCSNITTESGNEYNGEVDIDGE